VWSVGGCPRVVPYQAAGTKVPILFGAVIDPVGGGFVESLARPGGDVTGFLMYEYGISGKWLDGAADRDRRRAQGHQPLDFRSAGGARYTGRICSAPVRGGYGHHLAPNGGGFRTSHLLRPFAPAQAVHAHASHFEI